MTKTARSGPDPSTKPATAARRRPSAKRAGAAAKAEAAPAGGSPPASPYLLRTNGEAWWRWAWKTPQAKQWDDGALYIVARRASLEDDLHLLEADDVSVADVLGLGDESDMARELDWLIGRLRSIAGGRTGVMREMRELDARLGLDPKAMKGLGWKAGDEEADALDKLQQRHGTRRPARRARPARKAGS